MQTHQIQKPKTLRSSRRVGRGGKRGTYSGRGMKGQKSRAGHRIRPAILDYILRIPKLRGMTRRSNVSKFGSSNKAITPTFALNLSDIQKHFENGSTISPIILVNKKIMKRYKGRMPRVKILGKGDLNKSVTVKGVAVSASAREKIEKASGRIIEG